MAGRRHVVAFDRKSHEDGKSGIHLRRSSSESHRPLHFLSPSSTTTKDGRDSSFDIKKIFGDKEKDRDRTPQSVGDSSLLYLSRARSHSPIPPLASSTPPSPSPANANTNMASPPSSSKMHASPSKGPSSSALTSSGRTYDAKLVQREMLRLGTLAHQLPSAALATISNTTAAAITSASTLMLTASGGSTAVPAPAAIALGHTHGGSASLPMSVNGNDGGAWAQLNVHVLPLFNHEQLQSPIEDLNALVRRHIEAVMSRSPSRALATLEIDAAELINSGMITLNTKLSGIEDDKLIGRVVEIWGFFWDQVLPYVEGVFLPLQTDALLIALYRTPKPHRPSSPTMQDTNSQVTTSTCSPIDVRTIALRAFRDKIIVPIAQRLEARLVAMFRRDGQAASDSTGTSNLITEAAGYQQPRLQQMLLVLHSQAQRARPTLTLTAPAFTLTPQELAVRKLLDALSRCRHPLGVHARDSRCGQFGGASAPPTGLARRAPSFLSGGAPRDRRGRVAGKAQPKRGGRSNDDADQTQHADVAGPDDAPDDDEDLADTPGAGITHGMFYGGATPRGRFSAERERDRSFLESLRSPNPIDDEGHDGGFGEARTEYEHEHEHEHDAFSASAPRRLTGGWGLGPGGDVKTSLDDDDEAMDWDQAQAVVERMVGMSSESLDTEGMSTTAPGPSPALNVTPTPAPASVSRRRRMT